MKQPGSIATGCRGLFSLGAVCALVGCSNVDLTVAGGSAVLFPRRQEVVASQICAPPSIVELPPYKIMFVVDISYSTQQSDPTPFNGLPQRASAVKAVIDQYANQSSVSFAVIDFSDTASRLTSHFTKDPAVLGAAVTALSASQGGTDYADTLYAVKQMLQDDLATLAVADRRRTHYLVFWVSDGAPSLGASAAAGVVPFVTDLANLVRPQAAEFTFSTTFLNGGAPPANPQDAQTAKDLMTRMASAGGGQFVDIESGGTLKFQVSLTPTCASLSCSSSPPAT